MLTILFFTFYGYFDNPFINILKNVVKLFINIVLKNGYNFWFIYYVKNWQKLSNQLTTWISIFSDDSNFVSSSKIFIKRINTFYIYWCLYLFVISSFEQVKESLKASINPLRHS
jgi:hypothetical protein